MSDVDNIKKPEKNPQIDVNESNKHLDVKPGEVDERGNTKIDVPFTGAKGEKPATDVYGTIKGKTPDAKVDIPTEKAVEDAKHWADNQNQM